MSAYYNEHDANAAAWLRELIREGAIAPGDVDERSIAEVQPGDLVGYTQCHFFAGIGGWSLALRLAGWPDDRPVWTGSCPCQPFSAAGRGDGHADPRHLWPEWFRLIRECRPATVFGEQVSAAIRHGWWDAVQADLEGEDYACGMVVSGAHSLGAPHIRQRLWFVGTVEHADDTRPQGRRQPELRERAREQSPWAADTLVWLPCRDGKARPTESTVLGLVDGLPAHLGYMRDPSREGAAYLSPLVSGSPNRVMRLRGYGNAIVPQVAAAFIQAAGAMYEPF